jgi:hypothetical protein
VLLIGVALVALPSAPVVSSYVEGSAVHGSVEDGRFFVDPKHGMPRVEVSESTFETVYWVERLWPFSAWVPGLLGLFLLSRGEGPNGKPTLAVPREPPPRVLWACLAAAVFTVVATYLFWVVVGIPWATMVAGWLLVCVIGGLVAWFYARTLRQQPAGEQQEKP